MNTRRTMVSWLLLTFFSCIGVLFSAVSTYDFTAYLDQEVHTVTCSYIPGLIDGADPSGSSGCYQAMMSPYSSVFRTMTWGGIPISMFSLSVFAYLVFLGIDFAFVRKPAKPATAAYAIAATALPVMMSIIYFVISLSELGVLCKSCVGIYVASIGAFAFAVISFLNSRGNKENRPAKGEPLPWRTYGVSFAEGVVFVVVPLILFFALKPAYSDQPFSCGQLIRPEDKYGVRFPLNENNGKGVPTVVFIDPLCPACKAFHDRLGASGLSDDLNMEGVVFPLDGECNWMTETSLHPGSCAASEALLCAGERAPEVIDWIFANQVELRKTAEKSSSAVSKEVERKFPFLASCLRKPAVRSKINKSLRWLVANSATVLVPQLFVGGDKLCNEDSDLGLEYVLSKKIGRMAKSGGDSATVERSGQ